MKREPQLVSTTGVGPERLGISGGLTNLSALAIAKDFETLYNAVLEVAAVFVRLCRLTSVLSRAMEDRRGVWGWAILGIAPDKLGEVLDQFQNSIVSASLYDSFARKLICQSSGSTIGQKSEDWSDRRRLEHHHRPTDCFGTDHQPMSRCKKSPKERIEHPRSSAHCCSVPDGLRLHSWELGPFGHPCTSRLPIVGYERP